MKDSDKSNVEPPESAGDERAGSTAVVDTNIRQRRMALIMGIGCLISVGIGLWNTGFNTLTALMLSTGTALVLYWKTGADPKGWGKAIWSKKNTD